jgi:hypothetical protein
MADDDWRFSVEDVGDADAADADDDSETESEAASATAGTDEADGAAPRPPLEPGSPSLENALFVLLGVLLTLFVIVQVLVLAGG